MPKATTNKYGEKVNDFKEKFVEGVTFDSMYAITMYATKLGICSATEAMISSSFVPIGYHGEGREAGRDHYLRC